jgi:vacuolar-type H+-ATPase subunit I/STV1
MPRPERIQNQNMQSPQGNQNSQLGIPVERPGMAPSMGIKDDIRALNSSVLLVTQKIKFLVRNEKILGRNLVVINKKIKSVEDKIISPQAKESESASSEELEQLKMRINSLEGELQDLRSRAATKEEVKEVKFVVDSINPLEFATLSQVKDMIEKIVDKKMGKTEKK